MAAFLSRKFKLRCSIQKQLALRLISSTSQVADSQIDNNKAIKLINYLYVNNKKKGKYAYKTVEEALDIYRKITETPTYETIDTLLKLMFDFRNSRQYSSIWDDIRMIQSNCINASELISYSLLIKCCIDCRRIDTSNCIQILSWMKASNYTLKINELYIRKLIFHCSKQHDVESLDFIYSLFHDGFIENDPLIISTIFISAYSKCGQLQKAENIFDGMDMTQMDMVCIESMMKAFSDNDCHSDALALYDRLDSIENKKISKNNNCDSMALLACIQTDDFSKGQYIHEYVNKMLYDKGKSDFEMNENVRCSLISLYGHFGNIKQSNWLFKSMRDHHCYVDALNAMMTAYITNNDYKCALKTYKHAIKKNETSNVMAIKCCTETQNYILGERLCNHLNVKNRHGQVSLKNESINFFGQCSDIKSAENIFDSIMMDKWRLNAGSISLMMRVYMDNNESTKALELYDDMLDGEDDDEDEDEEVAKYISDGLMDDICHRMAIRACIDTNDMEKGEEIISVNEMLAGDYFDDEDEESMQMKNTLIDFYGYFGDIDTAIEIFNGMNKDNASVSCMMNAFIRCDQNEDALQLYDGMKHSDCDPMIHTLAINAVSNVRDLERGKGIHDEIKDILIDHIELKHALIEMYANTDIDAALSIFNSIEDEGKTNEIVESMMHGLRRSNMMKECLALFEDIRSSKYHQVKANLTCYIIALSACADANIPPEVGTNIHQSLMSYTEGNEWMLFDVSIRTALIEMYSFHGLLDECLKIFGDPSKEKEIIIWNALIAAFEKNGSKEERDELYEVMSLQTDLKMIMSS